MQASMLAWIITYLLHSTILVLGAWLLERRWSDRPERMSAVWKTALVGGLLTATVQTGLGIAPAAGHWDLSPELTALREPELPAGAEAVTAPADEPVAVGGEAPVMVGTVGVEVVEPSAVVMPAVGLAASPEPSWPPPVALAAGRVEPGLELDRGAAPVIAAASVEVLPPAASQTAEPLVTSSSSSSSSSAFAPAVPWVLAVLGLGALLGLASVLVAYVALRQQLAGRCRLAEGTLPTLLEGLRRRAGIGRRVPLTVAPRVRVPMAVGVLRPEIVVPPQAARSLPPAHQESLLAHELAHVLRHDPAWRLVALLVERVFFFQPLNRLASRRVAQSAEYLCDDWAARHTRQPLALASCLTEIATWVARPLPAATTMAGPRSILGRRVQRLLQPARASARPWWLGAALGLPLLGLVAVAPGASARAHAKGHRKAPERIVVIHQDGRRHALPTSEGGTIVVHERDGELVVRRLAHADHAAVAEPVIAGGEPPSRRDARKAARAQERARDKARQRAKKDLRRAFRDAKARGDAAPSRAEVEAILRQARKADGRDSPRRPPHPETMELHVRVPGELEVYGRVPLDLEGLHGLESLEELEALGPMLEELQKELEAAGIDVVLRRHDGAAEPELRIKVPPGHARARQVPPGHARARQDAERAHRHAERAGRDAEQREREAEALRRQVERALRERERERERMRRAPSSELPTVWNQRVAPPAPPAPVYRRRAPAPPASPSARPGFAPRPHAPLPPAAPSPPAFEPDEGSVVWISRPPTTSAASVVHS